MYGWIFDGISSLFEPVTGQNPNGLPGKGNVSAEGPTRPGVKAAAAARRLESNGRPAKRNYQSVYVADSVCQSDPVEVKRRKLDIVISFVKKTVAGVAGLLRLRNPLTTRYEEPRHCEDTQQSVTVMGIDELQTSWLNNTEWRMDKAGGGADERGGKYPFQSSSAPLMRQYSGSALSIGVPDRERRGSLQLLPIRPGVRVGTANSDPTCNGFRQNRCYKPSLTVEQALKQNDKEHYRRLLEMVTEKYSKTQPLPFNQAKQDESVSQVDHKITASGKTFESSVSRKIKCTAVPSVYTWRNTSATKDRWGGIYSKSVTGSFEDTQPVRCAKNPAAELDLSTEVATRLSLVDRDTHAISLYNTQSAHKRHSDEEIPRLTREMAAEVSGALSQRDPNLVLSAGFKLYITQRDLATLEEGCCLNDEVINFYLSLLMERGSSEAGRLKVYSFSTFFFPKLRGGGGNQTSGHAAVRRWTKAVDLFLFDLILVPLHLGAHWAMAVIDLKSKAVKSYDSLGHGHDDICRLLLLYLKEEHRAKKDRELDSAKWVIGSLRASEIPQQENGTDCGVFACKYADYIVRGKPLSFKQCHMPLFRKLMIWEILNRKLL
ncbi:sentrin-specific protease 2 [Parambassis ranga]|uniref:Sentrin-specific protease 2 n=1 Tax=Parambassis ranga TaxID=210632 RepID=A0A6P7HNP6_9TELE|nr:sentrin-specific protease 2-like [Parambassis ranga]